MKLTTSEQLLAFLKKEPVCAIAIILSLCAIFETTVMHVWDRIDKTAAIIKNADAAEPAKEAK